MTKVWRTTDPAVTGRWRFIEKLPCQPYLCMRRLVAYRMVRLSVDNQIGGGTGPVAGNAMVKEPRPDRN